ncbi:hypothetical protein [uncultured Shimia sp.]|uniref:hypothetical protein n=1 Tax=uncultured Shimia sp. TaxID=573152 RepID=UPI0025FB276F|nr:hypothetical protein [uncultured Shimia sp.]
MTHSLCIGALLATFAAPSVALAAECYADYKAKKDSPLRLHYGVINLKNGCDAESAKQEVAARIGKDGWTLLNVLSVFDASELSGKEDSAGQFYLRY